MKKIFSFFVLLAGVASFTACSDDDSSNPYAHESTVKVVGVSNLDLTSAGGEGYIVVDAPAGATVTSSKDWATATMVGDTVKVSVDLNSSLHDRNAVITIASGNDKATAIVHQLGFVFRSEAPAKLVFSANGARSASYYINHSSDLDVYADVDWIEAEMVEDSLFINVFKNESKHLRTGYVYMQSGEFRDSILIKQGLASYFVKKYYILQGENVYYDPEDPDDSPYVAVLAHITGTSTKAKLEFPDYDWEAAGVTIDANNLEIAIVPGYVGTFRLSGNNYNIGLCALDIEQGSLIWDSTPVLPFNMLYNEESEESGYMYGSLYDNGTWEGGKTTGLGFSAFNNANLDSYLGSLILMANPVLTEYDYDPSSASARKRLKADLANRKALMMLHR